MGYLDLHSHVLPGLDDGAPDLPAALAMLRGLAAIGFDHVCATPHQKAGQFMPTADAIAAAHRATVQALADDRVALTVSLAAENMWDATLFERNQDGAIPGYTGSSAFLVELPTSCLPVNVRDQMFRWQLDGRLPVLAHPERYHQLWRQPALVDALRGACAFAVDLGAVAGYHGRKLAKTARAMIRDGIAHAAASDAHTHADVRATAEGIAWIRAKMGAGAVTRLLEVNPRAILAGEHPDS